MQRSIWTGAVAASGVSIISRVRKERRNRKPTRNNNCRRRLVAINRSSKPRRLMKKSQSRTWTRKPPWRSCKLQSNKKTRKKPGSRAKARNESTMSNRKRKPWNESASSLVAKTWPAPGQPRDRCQARREHSSQQEAGQETAAEVDYAQNDVSEKSNRLFLISWRNLLWTFCYKAH